MKTLLLFCLSCLAGAAAVGLLSGCASTPDPLTTVIKIDTPGGGTAYVSSPKDTGLKSLMFSPETGELLVEDFKTSATDPTAAYMGVIAEQGKIQAEQSRQMTQLLGLLGQQAARYLPGGGVAPAAAPPAQEDAD